MMNINIVRYGDQYRASTEVVRRGKNDGGSFIYTETISAEGSTPAKSVENLENKWNMMRGK